MKTQFFFIGILFLLSSITSSATNQLMNYNIEYHTKNVTGAGTNNLVYIKIVGERGTIDFFRLSGDKDSGKTKSLSVEKPFIGRIKSITLDVHVRLAGDFWHPEWLKITVGDGGYYEFQPNTWVKISEKTFSPDFDIYPDYTETGDGKVMITPKIYTVVHGYDNLLSSSDVSNGFQYTETWTKQKEVRMASSTSNSVGAAFTVSYSSPETVYGSFGATAQTYFDQVVTKEEEESESYASSSEYSWSFGARAYTYRFQRRAFKIETGYSRYKMGDKWIYLRKLNARIEPVGSKPLEIPFRAEETGEIIPISWYELENEWLPYMDASERNSVLAKKSAWLNAGWVFEVNTPKKINWQKRELTYSKVSLNNKGNKISVVPGEQVSLSFDWRIKVGQGKLYCPSCIIQFYVGIKNEFSEVFRHQTLGRTGTQTGKESLTFTAPTNPGTYYITHRRTLEIRVDPKPAKHSTRYQDAIAIIRVKGLSDDLLPTPIVKSWSERTVSYYNVSLNRTSKNAIAVNPGQQVSLSFDWEVSATGKNGYCPGCIIQFYVGMKGSFSECFFSKVVSSNASTYMGEKNLPFTAPSEPGFYYITQARTLARECRPSSSRHSRKAANAIAVIQVVNNNF